MNLKKKRIFIAALLNVKDDLREKRIDEAMVKKTQDDLWKTCPNCSAQFPRSGRKCPECGIFFQKFLRENAVLLEDSKVDDSNSWSPTLHYQHVTNQHPRAFHKIVVLDPLLANPNSRYNILALCYHRLERQTGNYYMNIMWKLERSLTV